MAWVRIPSDAQFTGFRFRHECARLAAASGLTVLGCPAGAGRLFEARLRDEPTRERSTDDALQRQGRRDESRGGTHQGAGVTRDEA